MRNLAYLALLAACSVAALLVVKIPAQEIDPKVQTEAQVEEEHREWMQQVMKSISAIKPGMTRNDLAPLFAGDGGLQTRQHGRYVYAQCEYIKVDVIFLPVDDGMNSNPEDKIVKVSRPYLEDPFCD